MPKPADIRRQIRSARRTLSPYARRIGSQAAAKHFVATIRLLHSQRIALYLAADGEIDPAPLVMRLLAFNKSIYLPVLRPGTDKALWFCEYRQGDRLQPNRFGIAEPDIRHRNPVPPWGLDLIVLPLVAFSSTGTRMGMGGGYYDRTLAYQRRHPQWRKPKLIGYAYNCQKVEGLQREVWDIPLHGAITETGYLEFRNNK